jgi:hypothetical protein
MCASDVGVPPKVPQTSTNDAAPPISPISAAVDEEDDHAMLDGAQEERQLPELGGLLLCQPFFNKKKIVEILFFVRI